MMIPFYEASSKPFNLENETSFRLQYKVYPDRIVKAFPRFRYLEHFYILSFVDENGTFYILNCVREPSPSPIPGQRSTFSDGYTSWVNVCDSLDPEKDISNFVHWLTSLDFCSV